MKGSIKIQVTASSKGISSLTFFGQKKHETVIVNTGSVPLNDREPTPTLGGPTVQPPPAPATFFEPTEIAGSMPQNTMVENALELFWLYS